MFNVGGGELLVILLIALIVLGPDKLPNAARQMGKYIGEFRRISSGFQQEFRDAMKVDGLAGGQPARTTPAGGLGAAAGAVGATPGGPTAPGDGAGDAATGGKPPAAASTPLDVDGPDGSFS